MFQIEKFKRDLNNSDIWEILMSNTSVFAIKKIIK